MTRLPWSTHELMLLAQRHDHSARDVAEALGRTRAAVEVMRSRLGLRRYPALCGCGRSHYARGLCCACYKRARRNG